MRRLFLALFTLLIGFGLGWVLHSPPPSARAARAEAPVSLSPGAPIRVIYPDEAGRTQSVGLVVHRVEREAGITSGDRDAGQPWTFIVGPKDQPVWVYASSQSPRPAR